MLRTPPAAATTVPVATEIEGRRRRRDRDFDEGLQGDPDALAKVLLFGGAAAALALLAWFLARHMRAGLVYLIATPAVLVLIWFGYVYMDRYLPAL